MKTENNNMKKTVIKFKTMKNDEEIKYSIKNMILKTNIWRHK